MENYAWPLWLVAGVGVFILLGITGFFLYISRKTKFLDNAYEYRKRVNPKDPHVTMGKEAFIKDRQWVFLVGFIIAIIGSIYLVYRVYLLVRAL